jgi:hypothetical protein
MTLISILLLLITVRHMVECSRLVLQEHSMLDLFLTYMPVAMIGSLGNPGL